MSPREYLAWEKQQPYKHEYRDGKIYAMTGGTLSDNEMAVNLVTMLRNYLREKGCKVFVNDVKVKSVIKAPISILKSHLTHHTAVPCLSRNSNQINSALISAGFTPPILVA